MDAVRNGKHSPKIKVRVFLIFGRRSLSDLRVASYQTLREASGFIF
jgi:hypothetical protein